MLPPEAYGLKDSKAEFGERLYVPRLDWTSFSLAASNNSGDAIAQSDNLLETQPADILSKRQIKEDLFVPMNLILGDGLPSNLALFERSSIQVRL